MANPTLSQPRIVRDAPRRMGANERWEYQCLTCKDWMPPGKFRKRGKEKNKPRATCKGCEARAARWEAQSKAPKLAAAAWRRERIMRASGQAPDPITPFYERAALLTAQTGVKHDVDHIVPLKSPLVCGLNVPANLQVITHAENSRKGNQFTPYYETPDGHQRPIVEDVAYITAVKPQKRLAVRVVKR